MLAMAGDEGLEPSYLDLEASVLAAGRISRKLMAELTGVEPVPAERQSAILPIDHSSGSLPWASTTSSAVRAQCPAIGRGGSFEIVKDLAAGERLERPYPESKSRVLPLDAAMKLLAVSLSYNVRTTPPIDRGCGRAVCGPCEHDPQVQGDLRHTHPGR